MGMINFVGDALKEKKIYGGQICVCKGNRFEYIFGFQSANINNFVQSDTLYDAASLTKVLATMPIYSILVGNKEVKLTSKLSSFLPEFKYKDVTLYELLTHTSGLPASYDTIDKTKEEFISELYKLPCKDKKVVYSDIAYIFLGLAIEKIFNKGLDEVSKELIFEPLDMKNTSFNPKGNCAPTEYIDGKLYKGVHDEKARVLDGVAGHAGIFTTAHDIGNYIDMVLNGGNYKNKQIISEELIDKYWFKNLVYEKEANRYRSLCYITGDNPLVLRGTSESQISFHGFTGPSISIDRENNIGIAIVTNSVYPTRDNRTKLNSIRASISSSIYEDYGKTLIKK